MKYTARHVHKFLEQGRIDPDLWARHFPTVLPSRVPECTECVDFRDSSCPGGKNPVDCFLAIGEESQPADDSTESALPSGKVKGRFRWKGTGARGSIPAGANKAFDQSKE